MGSITLEPAALRGIPALENLGEQDLQALAERARIATYGREGTIFEQGEPCDSLCVILSGSVRLLTAAEMDGHEIVVASLEAGDYFGDEALWPGYEGRRTVNAIATETTTLAHITGIDYQAAAHQEARIIRDIKRLGSDQICSVLLQRLQQFHTLPLAAHSGEWLEEREFADGYEIYAQGTPADRFYMVLSGVVRLLKDEKLVARMGPGNFFGEQALIRSEPRDTSARSEGTSRVTCLSAERFLSLYGGSLEMRAQLQRLSGFCDLAARGLVTLHSGQFLDMESITAMYHFSDGPRITSTKVVGRPIFSMRRVLDGDVAVQRLIFEARQDGVYRQLAVHKGRIMALIAVGHWPDLGRVAESISQNRRIWPWQLALFQLKGELWLEREQESFAESTVVCRCTGVTRGALNEAVMNGCDTVEKLTERTGASQVCGSCAPLLAEIVGRSDMDPADLISIVPVTPSVKSFCFRPRHHAVNQSLPGQHIRIEGLIDGRWVQRSYTLTSPAGQQEHYEITVKREAHGLFSRWLHDRVTTDSAIRMSQPLGEFHLPPETRNPVVYLAGGIGMTPALAMVRSLPQLPKIPSLYLDYSAPTPDQFAYHHELTESAQSTERLQVNLRATDRQGLLGQGEVDRLVQRHPNARFYVCGPKPYEQAVQGYLTASGIDAARINTEHFTPPSGGTTAITSLKGTNTLLSSAALGMLLVAIFASFGPLAYQTSVEVSPNFEFLWTESAWKQLSGYSAGGLMLLGLGMSLRKRWRRLKSGPFAWWRIWHAIAGLLSLVLLVMHTGLSLGQTFNHWFVLTLLATMVSGSLVGLFIVLENHRPNLLCHRLKDWLNRLHIALSWPIAALLIIHVLSVYYF
ncbi:MAG: cyclic nucleotide-binding domain-containing protein [Pseudomonadota bacterium]